MKLKNLPIAPFGAGLMFWGAVATKDLHIISIAIGAWLLWIHLLTRND